jgi:glycosyltransferase involved in cell wall biosynthesis
MRYRYAIVTPVKNEENYLEGMIDSVVRQTVAPMRWIIVNDGSTDRTGEIIEAAASRHGWITGVAVRDPNGGNRRKPGGEAVLHHGLRRLDLSEYDYFARLDGDISFEHDYFERLFREFERNPRLGIASGVCYVWRKGKLIEEKNPRLHVRGAIKTYRVPCLGQIGGLGSGLGWDIADEARANLLGWQTRNFPELKVIHHRPTQTASGALKGRMNAGIAAYTVGYHPLFMVLRAGRNLVRRPYVLGGLSMLYGFLSGYLKSLPQMQDEDLIRYIREQQWNRLTGRTTIWK